MLIIGTPLEIVKSTKKFLSAQFSMKDLGAADVIIGIKILYTKNEIRLSQFHYIENTLKMYDSSTYQSCLCHITTTRSFDPTLRD